MPDINEIAKILGKMPVGTLNVLMVLGAFGLAAFAIYAMLVISKGRQ